MVLFNFLIVQRESPTAAPQMSVTTNSKTPTFEELTKQELEKEYEENNSEFLVWLEKLKKNKKLKSKFLSQMGIIKKEEPAADSDCIEIVDSDEGTKYFPQKFFINIF